MGTGLWKECVSISRISRDRSCEEVKDYMYLLSQDRNVVPSFTNSSYKKLKESKPSTPAQRTHW
jgi:hypothetical protein